MVQLENKLQMSYTSIIFARNEKGLRYLQEAPTPDRGTGREGYRQVQNQREQVVLQQDREGKVGA